MKTSHRLYVLLDQVLIDWIGKGYILQSRWYPLYCHPPQILIVLKKGYRLVGANELGLNFIYVKNGIEDDQIPEVSVESVLKHPSVKEGCKLFEPIKDWEYIEG